MTTPRGGRRSLPTPLKILRGETREERLNRKPPKPAGNGPIMPRDMDPRARTIWQRQTRALAKTGILTAVDSDLLRVYCEAVSRYEDAARTLASTGPVVRGANGELVKNPLHQIVRDNGLLMSRLAGMLSFAPTVREGIRVGEPDAPMDALSQWEASG